LPDNAVIYNMQECMIRFREDVCMRPGFRTYGSELEHSTDKAHRDIIGLWQALTSLW
jgi:hypothetical protein